MMKRNEGYALSYVLVILLVLSLIAVSVLSPPLRNLQNQQIQYHEIEMFQPSLCVSSVHSFSSSCDRTASALSAK